MRQWSHVRERGEAVAVIHSGRAHGREVRWRQSFAVGGHGRVKGESGGGERSKAWLLMGRGGMSQNNYQPVRCDIVCSSERLEN